jgi:hypothetical protein
MKIKLFVIALSIFASSAIAAKNSGASHGVSNIENQTKIYENTTAGRERADWSEGRVIEKGKSIQCSDPAFRRFGVDENC